MTARQEATDDSGDRRPSWVPSVVGPALLAVAGLAAYASSFAGQFLFDDRHHLLGPRRLESLWNLGLLLDRRRPVVDWSLAVNHAISGENPWSYHAVNLLIHVSAGLTLMGLVRRTLCRPRFEGRYDRSAPWLAFWVALFWLVHPLNTQAVTYVIQRAESLMGFFYLLTLYAVVRSVDARRPGWWLATAVAACALGMGSKAVMVTAPLVVLLYDRTFLASSLRDALMVRRRLYLGLMATWGVLVVFGVARGVLTTESTTAAVGFSVKTVSPLGYALTQFGVFVHYLRLSFWPHPLCLDYGWPFARTAADVLVPAAVILPVIGATVLALYRRKAWGFVGAFFFLVLAPTSSIVPIKDALFEHRMYLPLAGVVVFGVLAFDVVVRRWRVVGRGGGRRAAVALGGVIVVALTSATDARNRVYHDELGMWRDVREKRPTSSRAARNYGNLMLLNGDRDEALAILREGVRLDPTSADLHNAVGFALVAHRRMDEAIAAFREAVRLAPGHLKGRLNLGKALAEIGRREEAAEAFDVILRLRPDHADALLEQGNNLVALGRPTEAVAAYRRLLSVDSVNASGWTNLGVAQLNLGDAAAAADSLRRALSIRPDALNALNNLGIALSASGHLDEAMAAYRRALSLDPNFAGAHFNLGRALVEREVWSEAIEHFQAALRGGSQNIEALFGLGLSLEHVGRDSEAAQVYRQVLTRDPGHDRARQGIERLRGAEKEATDAPE